MKHVYSFLSVFVLLILDTNDLNAQCANDNIFLTNIGDPGCEDADAVFFMWDGQSTAATGGTITWVNCNNTFSNQTGLPDHKNGEYALRSVSSANSWCARAYTTTTWTREANREFRFLVYGGPGDYQMIGWGGNSTGNLGGNSYVDGIYMFYFQTSDLLIYEDGASIGTFSGNLTGGYTNGWYEGRIVLKSSGADYYLRKMGDHSTTTAWNLIYSSSYSSESNLRLLWTPYSGTQYTDGWSVSNPGTQVMGPGEYILANVTSGIDYTFETVSGFNTQITGFNNSGGSSAFYDDDGGSGTLSLVNWTATFTGSVRILVDQYNCQGYQLGTGQSAVLRIIQNLPSAGAIAGGTNSIICENGTTASYTNAGSASGGVGSFEYKWQYWNYCDLTPQWTDVSGASGTYSSGNTTYNPPDNHSCQTKYRRVIRNISPTPNCGTDLPANEMTVNIFPEVPAPPTVAKSPADIGGGTCFEEDVTLTVSGMAPGGQAADFNGSTSNINLGNPSALQITGSQTIEMWLYPHNFSERRNPYAKAYGGEGTITQETDGTMNYYYGTSGTNGGTYQVFGSGTSISLNTWTHIAIVRDLNDLTLTWYINGNVVNTTTANHASAVSGSNSAYIGQGYVFNYDGYIDNVRIWNVARTALEIRTDMMKEDPSMTTGLVATYSLNGNANANGGSGPNGTPSNLNPYIIPTYFTYTWSGPGTPNISPNPTTSEFTTIIDPANTNSGSYTVHANSTGGPVACADGNTNSVSVTIHPELNGPTVFSNDISSCGPYILGASPGTNGTTARFYSGDIPPSAGGTGTLEATGTGYPVNSSTTIYVVTYNGTTLCESEYYETVNITINPTFTLSLSNDNSIAYNGFGVSCQGSADGSITATPSGGTAPYSFAWSNGTNTVGATSTISGVQAGVYSVNVTDDAGCTNSGSIVLAEPGAISISGSVSTSTAGGFNLNCNGYDNASITGVAASGGTNTTFTYDWADVTGTSNPADRTGLSAGSYILEVSDANGCTSSRTYTLTEPAPLAMNISVGYDCSKPLNQIGILTGNATGGVSPYTYRLNGSTSNGTNTFNNLSNGTSYYIEVTDANGCSKNSSSVLINYISGTSTENCEFIYVSNSGDPNTNDGNADCPATLSRAFQLLSGARNHILMLGGTYTSGDEFVVPSSNFILDGGYKNLGGGEWVKSSASADATILQFNSTVTYQSIGSPYNKNVGHIRGLVFSSITGFTVKDITVNTRNALSNERSGINNSEGISNYAIYLNSCSGYKFIRVKVNAGNGSKGLNGNDGGDGGAGIDAVIGNPIIGTCYQNQNSGNHSRCDCSGWFNFCLSNSCGNGGCSAQGLFGGPATSGGSGGNAATRLQGGTVSGGTGEGGYSGGTGGRGGAGASSGFDLFGCGSNNGSSGLSGSSGSGYSGVSGGGGGAAGGGSSGNCNSGKNAGNGGNGNIGTAGSNGSTGTAGLSNGFYVPGFGGDGARGRGGTGGGGGGGGGGSAASCGSTCYCTGDDGPGGPGGGGGGGGGGAGSGGAGSGSSYGFFVWNSSSGSSLLDCQVTTGTAPTGGSGGIGGDGGRGGFGIGGWNTACSGSKPGNAGNSGTGGTGGKGGNGGVGSSGEAVSIKVAAGSSPTVSGSSVPNPYNITVSTNQGCTNSEITITKSGGSWGGSLNYIPNRNSGQSLYNSSSSPAVIYYSSQGTYNIVNSSTYREYVVIDANRIYGNPVINAISSPICGGAQITLGSTTGDGTQDYDWSISQVNQDFAAAPLTTFTGKNPGVYTMPNTPGIYLLKLRVHEECCGWSIPTYTTVEIKSPPAQAAAITGPIRVCAGTPHTYSIAAVANADSYFWTVPSGAVINSGQNSTSITVTFGTTSGNVAVTPQGCSPDPSARTTAVTVDLNPTTSVNGALSVCIGDMTTLNGQAVAGTGGSGTFDYQWFNGSMTQIATTQSIMVGAGTYTFRASDQGNGCFDDETVVVSETADLAITAQPADVLECPGSGTTANFNVSANGTNLSYQWQFNSGSGWNNLSNGGSNPTYAGVTTNSLTLIDLDETVEHYLYRSLVTSDCPSPSTSLPSSSAELDLQLPTITSQPTDIVICENGDGQITLSASFGISSVEYKWYTLNGPGTVLINGATHGGIYSGFSTNTLIISNAPLSINGYQYLSYVNVTGCNSPRLSNSVTVTIDQGNNPSSTWGGGVDSDWHKPGNWSDCIPGPLTDVIIPSGMPNSPVVYVNGAPQTIGNGVANCNTLDVKVGASLNIQGNAELNINK